MDRPVSTFKILGVLLLVSMFLNVLMLFDMARAINRIHSYQEECGDRTDAPVERR